MPEQLSSDRPRILQGSPSIVYSLIVGLSGLAALTYSWVHNPVRPAWFPILFFASLSFVVQRSSFHLGSSIVLSLSGVIDLAAVLALGPTSGATVAALSGFSYPALHALRGRRFTPDCLFEIPLFNAGLKAWMALATGALYSLLSGWLFADESLMMVVVQFSWQAILAGASLCLLWFSMDHVGWGILDYLEGGTARLGKFISETIPKSLVIELLPLSFSLVVALVYMQLGWLSFLVLTLIMVAVAVLAQRWAATREQLEQRVAELTTVELVGLEIAQAQLDVDGICGLMYEHAKRLTDATIFHLGLFDGDTYVLKLLVREGHVEPVRTFALAPGVGLVSWLRESKQPILVRDFEKEMDALPARPAYIAERPPRSALFVPLVMGEDVVGTLSVQSYQRNAYGESDLRILSAMANQAAVAIQKARLYAQENKRVSQLEIIHEVSRRVSAIMELEQLFSGVVAHVRENFDYYYVTIYTADTNRQTIDFQASSRAGGRELAIEVAWGQGIIGWVAAQEDAIIVNDVAQEPRYRSIDALEEARSEMAVPLMLEGKLVGVLDVQSDQRNAFGPDDLFILETLGSQIALAIHEAHLYEAERQQAWLSTALLQVAEAASRLSDMDDVFTTIVRLVPLLAGVDRCALLLWKAEEGVFVPTQTYGLASDLRGAFTRSRFRPTDIPALEWVRWEQKPLLVNVARDEGMLTAELARQFDIHEMVLLPLLAQADLLGVIMVDYAGKAHPFDDHIVDMLAGLANQAATVIHSALLVRAQQEEAYTSMALLQVADTISRSANLEDTMAAIARITPMLVGVESCGILLEDQRNEVFIPSHLYGFGKDRALSFWALQLSRDEYPMRDLLGGAPYVSVGYELLGERASLAHNGPPLTSEEGASLLLLPLNSKGDVVGAMLVEYLGLGPAPSHRWMSILYGIASQAAIAVENDLLLQEASEQERMRQELEVARRIQTSFLPELCPTMPGWDLATVWRSARQVGGDFYDFIPLPASLAGGRERTGVVVADVSDKGVPAALFMALSRTLVRTVAIDGRPPESAISRANNLILADARSNLFVTLFYAILESDSGQITYVNAGHMPALLLPSDDRTLEELRTDGIALGVVADFVFEQRTACLDIGDTLILYSDGVIESSNIHQEMFGKERLIEIAHAHRRLSAEELANRIDEAISDFVGSASQFDDFTLVVAKRSLE